jgi:hypothetical protein
MRPLNLGLFAVLGGIVGVASCADDPAPPEIIPGPNMPFPTGGSNTGGIRATGGANANAGGSKNSGSGSGGRSATSSKCPTEEPDYGDACTPPTDGTTLKCVYEVTTTCTCRRSVSTGKMIWDCASNTATGGKAGTGGRAAFGQGATTGQGGGAGGGTAKAGGFGF